VEYLLDTIAIGMPTRMKRDTKTSDTMYNQAVTVSFESPTYRRRFAKLLDDMSVKAVNALTPILLKPTKPYPGSDSPHEALPM
jgi:hypothetical protein